LHRRGAVELPLNAKEADEEAGIWLGKK
jgi:hypothetical protein